MATENQDRLTDAYANAAGGGLFYESAAYKGFQMGVSGYLCRNQQSIRSFSYQLNTVLTGKPYRRFSLNRVQAK